MTVKRVEYWCLVGILKTKYTWTETTWQIKWLDPSMRLLGTQRYTWAIMCWHPENCDSWQITTFTVHHLYKIWITMLACKRAMSKAWHLYYDFQNPWILTMNCTCCFGMDKCSDTAASSHGGPENITIFWREDGIWIVHGFLHVTPYILDRVHIEWLWVPVNELNTCLQWQTLFQHMKIINGGAVFFKLDYSNTTQQSYRQILQNLPALVWSLYTWIHHWTLVTQSGGTAFQNHLVVFP
jgi:hypothetical protein